MTDQPKIHIPSALDGLTPDGTDAGEVCPELVAWVQVQLELATEGVFQGGVLLFTNRNGGAGVQHIGETSMFGTLCALQVEQTRVCMRLASETDVPLYEFEHALWLDSVGADLFTPDRDAFEPFRQHPLVPQRIMTANLEAALEAAQRGMVHGMVLFATNMHTDHVLVTRGGELHYRWLLPSLQVEVMRFGSHCFKVSEQMKAQNTLVQPVHGGFMPRG